MNSAILRHLARPGHRTSESVINPWPDELVGSPDPPYSNGRENDMKPLVSCGAGNEAVESRPMPDQPAGDAGVKIIKVAICGSNGHILTSDALICTPRVFGHEEIGASTPSEGA